jgi:hypothetical protein
MTRAGDNLIESTARAPLRERSEATPWFWIKMTQEQRRAAIGRKVDAYGIRSLPMPQSGCSGLAKQTNTRSISSGEAAKVKAPHKGALRMCRP